MGLSNRLSEFLFKGATHNNALNSDVDMNMRQLIFSDKTIFLCLQKLCSPPIVMQVVHKLSFGRKNKLFILLQDKISEGPPACVSGSGGHFSPISRLSEPEPRIEAPALVCRDLTNNQHTVNNRHDLGQIYTLLKC